MRESLGKVAELKFQALEEALEEEEAEARDEGKGIASLR